MWKRWVGDVMFWVALVGVILTALGVGYAIGVGDLAGVREQRDEARRELAEAQVQSTSPEPAISPDSRASRATAAPTATPSPPEEAAQDAPSEPAANLATGTQEARQLQMEAGTYWDIDSWVGQDRQDDTTDFSLNRGSRGYSLYPMSTAEITSVGEQPSFQVCSGATDYRHESAIPVETGSFLCIRTTDGFLAGVVAEVVPEPQAPQRSATMTFLYVTLSSSPPGLVPCQANVRCPGLHRDRATWTTR